MLDKILRFADKNRYTVGESQLESDNSFSAYTSDLDSRTFEKPSDTGVRMIEHEDITDFTTSDGNFSSLVARSASSHTINLGRLLGLPENQTFDEGLRKVELKRTLEDHYDFFEESGSKMPVYVPSRVKEFMDLRLSPETRSDGEYPCTMIYDEDTSVPVFLRDFQDLIQLLEKEDYQRFHQDRDNMSDHTEYQRMLNTLKDVEEDGSLFAIPHIYREDSGVYYPAVEDVTLVNVVDNVFSEPYDSSYLDRTGNSSTRVVNQ